MPTSSYWLVVRAGIHPIKVRIRGVHVMLLWEEEFRSLNFG